MTLDDQVNLHGRIAALEMIMTGLLADRIRRTDDPLGATEQGRKDLIQSFQIAQRAVGDYEDAVTAAAAKAVNQQFANLRARLIHEGFVDR